jgi:molybdopterin-guanine dinucleotide biosynthesis protein A
MIPRDGIAPLYGLVLAGGGSTRMGRDKAALEYHGVPQVHHAYALMQSRCEKVFVSARDDQADDDVFGDLPLILDDVPGGGPMVGVLSAMRAHPDAAWFVVACDMPFLTDDVVDEIVAGRDATMRATVAVGKDDRLEPLCCIYEPANVDDLACSIAKGDRSLRDYLAAVPVVSVTVTEPDTLSNVNNAKDLEAARIRVGDR